MKKIGQFCRKSVAMSALALSLACSTFAGAIPYPGVTASAPITNGDMQHPVATVDSLTETALILLQGALSLI